MSKIDLSKAKLGDKFITKEGRILTLTHQGRKYTLIGRGCFVRLNQNGKLYEDNEESKFDLIEQVFDKPLDELIEEGTKQLRESRDAIAEENELQRRQEVLKYADRLFFNQKDTRIELFGYPAAIEAAEDIVKLRDKYLKDGKL